MLKSLISGVAGLAHIETAKASEQEPLRRTCAYIDAAAAGALIVVASLVLYWT
jgi:hypothetical protein